jgi:hypothetical protein
MDAFPQRELMDFGDDHAVAVLPELRATIADALDDISDSMRRTTQGKRAFHASAALGLAHAGAG